MHLFKQLVFYSSETDIFCRNLVFEKCPILCPFFGFANWEKWCTLLFRNLDRTKTTLKPPFFRSNLVFVAKHQNIWHLGGENKTHELGTLVLFWSKRCFLWKGKRWCVKNHYFSAGFWWQMLCMFNPFLYSFGFVFFDIFHGVLVLFLLVVVFWTSSLCVLVVVSFLGGLFCFSRGLKGQVRWPEGRKPSWLFLGVCLFFFGGGGRV